MGDIVKKSLLREDPKMKTAILLLFATSSASAQVAVRGLAFDSLHGRPLPGAFVGIVGMNVTAVSDSAGRFLLRGVPIGTHRLVMQHDVLDALGLSAAGARAVVTGEKDSVVIAIPSFPTLWRAACGRPAPAGDTGLVFGNVSRGGRPISASVATTWLNLYQDSTKAVRQTQTTVEVDADSAGSFAVCGVPTNTGLSVRASVGATSGSWVDLPPLNKERIARRDLSMTSPTRSETPIQLAFTGRVLRDSTNAPLADAEIFIPGVGLSAVSNARGEFRILGVSPGTHTVQVRKIGYTFTEQRVDFETQSLDRTLLMSRIATLDSVTVTASRYPRTDEAMRSFEDHRKIGLGKFLTREDLAKTPNSKVGSLVAQWPAIQVANGPPGVAWLIGNARGAKSITGNTCAPIKEDFPPDQRRPFVPCPDACYPRVFVDGIDVSRTQVPNINRYISDDLEAIEQFNVLNARCGVLVLHTRRRRSP
jgi:hypothetical protein